MARLTKEEHNELMSHLMGDEQNDEMEELVRKLRDDFDESLAVDEKEVNDEEGDKEDWKSKYDDLYSKYKERFLDVSTSGEEVKKEQTEDVKEDDKSTKKTYTELFKEKEKKSNGN